jgi:hypothetical protein
MSSFRKPLTVTRYTGAAYNVANGEWSGGSSAQIAITASVQPANDKARENLPEGYDTSSVILLITDTELQPATSGGQQSDTVAIEGEDYHVTAVERWQNAVIPHYTATVALPDA